VCILLIEGTYLCCRSVVGILMGSSSSSMRSNGFLNVISEWMVFYVCFWWSYVIIEETRDEGMRCGRIE
jgi:hypothetical protein